jgi:misacylated tRNA(Ala) deacylase
VAAAHPGDHPLDQRRRARRQPAAGAQHERAAAARPPAASAWSRSKGVDLQPCGGTHVANTAEIGAVVVTKIEKKSAAQTRRVVLGFESTP